MLSLKEIKAQYDKNGEVEIKCSKHFANAVVKLSDERYLLSMPLSAEAITAARRAEVRLKAIYSSNIPSYKILPQEMSYRALDGVRFMDLLLQRLPDGGEFLTTAIEHLDIDRLLISIKDLEQEFERLNLVHCNLKAENIVITSDYKAVPLNYHYCVAMSSSDYRDDFEALARWVESYRGKQSSQQINEDIVSHKMVKSNYLSIGSPFEGLCIVEDVNGYGYIDSDGVEVIPTQFLEADDFREGRAEVKTSSGMGLIDKRGNFIIPPIYEIVDFVDEEGYVLVRQDGLWAQFSYNGEQIGEFRALY